MLEAKNIHKVYNNGKKELAVLKGVDFKVAEGEFAAIVGPSGAGKSTLLHILGGLDLPSQGEVIFQEQNIYKLKDSLLCAIRNKKIGFVFQFYHLLPEFTVLENVLMPALIGCRVQGAGCRVKEEALRLLKEVGLSERAGHFPSELSGGEKQRVAIARGLINRPRLLFCDEPTGNLDSGTGDEIISLIKEMNRGEGMSVVLVTHNQALAEKADKLYHLKDGILLH